MSEPTEADLAADLKPVAALLASDARLSQELYAALCNNEWRMISTGQKWSCSWRAAGGIVAELRNEGARIGGFAPPAQGACSGCGRQPEEHREEQEEVSLEFFSGGASVYTTTTLWCEDGSGWSFTHAQLGSEDYLDFYCSGMSRGSSAEEGEIRGRPRALLAGLGWEPLTDPEVRDKASSYAESR